MLKRPKRPRTYGDGTELDGIEDLPLDREKEGRYRVQPKGYINRIPGATFTQRDDDKMGTRRPLRQDSSNSSLGMSYCIFVEKFDFIVRLQMVLLHRRL